jgi:predicted DNA-binding ribbon-helix-helix protein
VHDCQRARLIRRQALQHVPRMVGVRHIAGERSGFGLEQRFAASLDDAVGGERLTLAPLVEKIGTE